MTGVEMLEELLKEMKALKDQVQLIDANIKVLGNRVAKLLTSEVAQQSAPKVTQPAPVMVKTTKEPAPQKVKAQEGPSLAQKTGRLVYKKVYGYLKNQQGQPIEEALVLVYNSHNEVCASSVSDPTGLWETMLTPGRYAAEFKKDNFPAVNRSFEFTEFVKDYEVK